MSKNMGVIKLKKDQIIETEGGYIHLKNYNGWCVIVDEFINKYDSYGDKKDNFRLVKMEHYIEKYTLSEIAEIMKGVDGKNYDVVFED